MHSLGELCTSSFVWECHVDSGLVQDCEEGAPSCRCASSC